MTATTPVATPPRQLDPITVEIIGAALSSIVEEMGGRPMAAMPGVDADYGLMGGGRIIHEVGVTRMGHEAKTSVVNANCQTHDVKNVFVADGGPFVSQPDKNPTWTILALAWRTSDYILAQRKEGAI